MPIIPDICTMRYDSGTTRGWPIAPPDCTGAEVGQAQVGYENHLDAWWIVWRDSYRRAYRVNGPHSRKMDAVASHMQALGY